jgi:hypothetical protein
MADLSTLSARFDATVWTGVGILGILLFVVGIYQPALAGLPDANALGILVAVGGAAIAVFGFTLAQDRRALDRKRPRRLGQAEPADRSIAPSLEVYDPRFATEAEPEPSRPDPPA